MDKAVFQNLDVKYSPHASWAIWNPDDLLDTSIIRRSLESLKSSVVMVALNLSRFVPNQWQNFHSHDHARKLMYAFNRSPYRGAYMTDLIKGEVDPSSAALAIRIRNASVKVDKHIQAFRQEMHDLDANDQTLFILFGRRVTRIFQTHLAGSYPNHVSCPHYSMYGIGYTDAEWVAKTWRILEEHYRATFGAFNMPPFQIDDEMQTELDLLRKQTSRSKLRNS
jgi:hypothetical protein